MKTLSEKINEGLGKTQVKEANINENLDASNYLDQMKEGLVLIEKEIKKETGYSVKLDVTIENNRFLVTSKDLMKDLKGTIAYGMFKELKVFFWGGNVFEENGQIIAGFGPKVSYKHVTGGGNGCDLIWNGAWYNISKNSWTYRK